jgi:hypothetical protein
MTENTERNASSSGLSKLNFFLIIVIGISLLVIVNEQSTRDKMLYELLTSRYTVDFSVRELQSVNDRFFLGGASQEQHLTGVKFAGRMINSLAVDHTDVTFELKVGSKSKEFVINRISAGNSTAFNVYIPELRIEDARYAQIEYKHSKVHFRTR